MSGKNKSIGLIITLIISLVISLIINIYLVNSKILLVNQIEKKNKAITEIRHSIKIITRSNNSIDSIKNALEKDFVVITDITHNDNDSSFAFVVTPKDWNKIDYSEIWDFYGLELIFDKNKKFKRIDFYKP